MVNAYIIALIWALWSSPDIATRWKTVVKPSNREHVLKFGQRVEPKSTGQKKVALSNSVLKCSL